MVLRKLLCSKGYTFQERFIKDLWNSPWASNVGRCQIFWLLGRNSVWFGKPPLEAQKDKICEKFEGMASLVHSWPRLRCGSLEIPGGPRWQSLLQNNAMQSCWCYRLHRGRSVPLLYQPCMLGLDWSILKHANNAALFNRCTRCTKICCCVGCTTKKGFTKVHHKLVTLNR